MFDTGLDVNILPPEGKFWDEEIKLESFTQPTKSVSSMIQSSSSSDRDITAKSEKPDLKIVEIEKKPKIFYAKGILNAFWHHFFVVYY